MADEMYQKAVVELIREVMGELIYDAVGLAEWKLRQKATIENQYGTAEFPSDSGFTLSTFSSTPSDSPKTPSFNDLAGTQLTDEKSEKENQKDENLVKYLNGEISKSEGEENQTDQRVNLNLHDKTNPHATTDIKAPMVPIDTSVIVETERETKKNKSRVASKDKKKITDRGGQSVGKEKEICKEY